MPLITAAYFDGPLIIAGQNETHTAAALTAAIARYEVEYLQKVLGAALYAAYVTGIAVTPTPADKWLWIRDGHTYTYSGRSVIWPGLKDTTTYRSPIANYIYFKYRTEKATLTVSTGGEVKAKSENSEPAAIDRKMVSAWNQMVEWNRLLYTMVDSLRDGDAALYTEWERPYVNDRTYGWELFEPVNVFGF